MSSGDGGFVALWRDLWQPSVFGEIALLVVCVALAWGVLRVLRPAGLTRSVLFGRRVFDGVLFPLLALALMWLGRMLLENLQWPVALMRIAVPVMLSLAVIRLTVQVLHNAFPDSRVVALLERTVSWGIWLLTILWVTGILQPLLEDLEAISWHVGDAQVSLRGLIEGALAAVTVLIASLWLSAVIEVRLMAAERVDVAVRKIGANVTRGVLLLVGVLIALSAAGIPLSALGVFGGALGVGIGLGLQKLAANYVSGFVLLAERSLRIGDLVAIENFEGRITDITTRYTVIRSLAGREAIVPNETLITQRVDNLTYADSKLVLVTNVQVAYRTDLDALFPKILKTVVMVPRVLPDPGPAVRLSAFADSGLELTIAFWISDPENGQSNAIGAVNLAVLRLFNAEGIEIPFPQRVVHTIAAPDAAPPASAASEAPGGARLLSPGAAP